MGITMKLTTLRRGTLAALGLVSLALGIIGVFVPGLPTTEFVLAASYLFARSSPRLEGWLERNRWVGPSLRQFRETGGMPRRAKIVALVSMWIGLGISVHLLAGVGSAAQVIALGFGLAGRSARRHGCRDGLGRHVGARTRAFGTSLGVRQRAAATTRRNGQAGNEAAREHQPTKLHADSDASMLAAFCLAILAISA